MLLFVCIRNVYYMLYVYYNLGWKNCLCVDQLFFLSFETRATDSFTIICLSLSLSKFTIMTYLGFKEKAGHSELKTENSWWSVAQLL